jgi:hypothetical protein
MGFVMPEIIVQRVIQHGIRELRKDKPAFLDIFEQLTTDELGVEYGANYLEEIWTWFSTTKLPVVQAWALNVQKIPCISVHLANETEDETKAAMNDLAGIFGDESELGTAAFTVMIDIGIHANKAGDNVLWLYYIVSYILFKHKLMAHRLGLKLSTFSASDYNKDNSKMAENIWTRWIRFRTTTQNFWGADKFGEPVEAINTDPAIGLPAASSIAATEDVNVDEVDTTANKGILASRTGDEDGEEDLSI